MTYVCVVTGSYKGIGRETVKLLCKACKDAAIVMTSRNVDAGFKSLNELNEQGYKNIFYHQLDISDQQSIKNFCKWIQTGDTNSNTGGWGKIDILVNNAGIAYTCNDTTPVEVQAKNTLQNNYFDTKNFTKYCGDLFATNSRVVTVASVCGQRALMSPALEKLIGQEITEENLDKLASTYIEVAKNGTKGLEEKGFPTSTYGMSKALDILMVSMWGKKKPDWIREDKNVTFVSMCPGWCQTDMAGWEKPPRTAEEGASDVLFCCAQGNEKNISFPDPQKYSIEEIQGQFVSDRHVVKFT